jgi:hypothetical protein
MESNGLASVTFRQPPNAVMLGKGVIQIDHGHNRQLIMTKTDSRAALV